MTPEETGAELIRLGTALRLGAAQPLSELQSILIDAALNLHHPDGVSPQITDVTTSRKGTAGYSPESFLDIEINLGHRRPPPPESLPHLKRIRRHYWSLS